MRIPVLREKNWTILRPCLCSLFCPSLSPSAARHVRAAVAVTMASRFEDDLSRAHQRPIQRFRRAVRQVISLTREARSRQARMQARQMPTQAAAQQQPHLGDTMVRHLNRQVRGPMPQEETMQEGVAGGVVASDARMPVCVMGMLGSRGGIRIGPPHSEHATQ